MKLLYAASVLLPSAAAKSWGPIIKEDPQNWAPTPRLIPTDGVLGRYNEYTADSFATYVSDHCKMSTRAIASYTYSGKLRPIIRFNGMSLV
ncbi:hypothetical protein PT974_08058 [Cladobotryum mycophilum]|uniref:Uncharacterized protein n=1 Tax=Cladobotryum mycophilum TaxID=491253 RepID=A0ABR0SC94_9HYPO